jgi:hypothetical protein
MFILSMSLISKAFASDSIFDGYKRVAALEQLGRDTVEAVIWPLNEVQVGPSVRSQCELGVTSLGPG